MDYMTLREAGEKWGISPRQINYYCSEGRIPGAEKMGTVWLIPKDAQKPVDGRTKQGRALKHGNCKHGKKTGVWGYAQQAKSPARQG